MRYPYIKCDICQRMYPSDGGTNTTCSLDCARILYRRKQNPPIKTGNPE
jgi:hypothetical protein